MNGKYVDDEAFIVFHKGVALHLHWSSVPPLERAPVLRLRELQGNLLVLLTIDGSLYLARYEKVNSTLHVELKLTRIVDVDFCRTKRNLFVVTDAGLVLTQQLSVANPTISDNWETLIFDPLELAEEGIAISRVCCSSVGVIFITVRGDIYSMGSCGEISAQTHPQHLRLFEENREVIDVAAGDDFFVILLKQLFVENDDSDEFKLQDARNKQRTSYNIKLPGGNAKTSHSHDSEEILNGFVKKQDLNSNTSLHSFSSKSNQSDEEHSFVVNLKCMLKQGRGFLATEVCTFGASNNGLLGTGDHIKRTSVNNIQKLENIGVCNISTGREYTVARSVDGRLFHWGLNTKGQLNGKPEIIDISSPTEFNLDKIIQNNKQESCSSVYQSMLPYLIKEIFDNNEFPLLDKDFLTLYMGNATKNSFPLFLATEDFTVHNFRQFQRDYQSIFRNLQVQMKCMLKYRYTVQMLQLYQQKTAPMPLKNLWPLYCSFHKILYMLASVVKSFESFYRNDFDNPADLIFIRYYRECIEIFKEYTQNYCDIYCIDGFSEAVRVFQTFSGLPLSPDQREDTNLPCVFRQPFQIFPNIIEFLEKLLKSRHEFTEHFDSWRDFARQNLIDLELAENTLEFWQSNERNSKLRIFRTMDRRVILTSTNLPIKLANSIIMSSLHFILFSDCLCQVGKQVLIYPLVAMWLKMENETSFQVITPERTFTLNANSPANKMLWYEQMESAIVSALHLPEGSKLSSRRTAAYVFSRNHAKYARVHAKGRWRNGVMHGNCYLDYPDGKCYYGNMRHGEIEGFGKMLLPSVGLYEGEFKAGKFHGYGKFEMKDKEEYEGYFRDNLFHGHGMLRSNYYTYMGEFQANTKSGYGVLDDMVTGDKYMGMFADNKRAGAGTCITMDGNYFEGIFANDEMVGTGIAVFENECYYEGELTMRGPNGKGTYYMSNKRSEGDILSNDNGDISNLQLIGNVLSGSLAGNWNEVRIVNGTMAVNIQYPKYPKSIGELVVDNNRKWRSLFDNFAQQFFGAYKKRPTNDSNGITTTKNIWTCIVSFMNVQKEREKSLEQENTPYQSTNSYFNKNISLGYSNSFDKLSIKSTNSLLTTAKSSILDASHSFLNAKLSHSQETLNDADLNDADFFYISSSPAVQQNDQHSSNSDELNISNDGNNSLNSLMRTQFSMWTNDSALNSPSSLDSSLNLSTSLNNNSFTTQNNSDYIPSFGMNSLTEQDVSAIKTYLNQAFQDRYHPLYLLNQRIENCFHTSYGCWKVKPTPILARQAMLEWESISKRVYKFIRSMFPALPEDYCIIESSREVISHITLLYPIILSNAIYSILFVLYANKYSQKDEMYRQNIMYAEKLNNDELAKCLGLDSSFLPVINHPLFDEAIQTFQQLQIKHSPKAMLTVIEKCMQLITDTHKVVEQENAIKLDADNIMALTLFLVLRAIVPHLGAELALLDDLTGGSNFQFEMNGLAGYCYTTIKASYEHITAKPLNKT
ncbi:alsin homolog [Teleopsis dalmanni]|uniref:alsin homolog n=1 Tax=Teleopsis dalmanni TaxID=139649 RepID=UPI0018CC8129|nr:alsin homolog [Teleopsis dalmanni]XP_037957352.1 alsin homolog [Teleopsis dalmanni]